MMYPFKVLNKKKYTLCFINAFLENICLYIMPVILSIFLSIPFSLEKFKWLIILTIAIKILEIFFNILWTTKVEPFLEVSKKDLQIAYFKRLCNMNVSRINNTHTGYLKKQLDIISEETVALLDEIMMTVNGFCVALHSVPSATLGVDAGVVGDGAEVLATYVNAQTTVARTEV